MMTKGSSALVKQMADYGWFVEYKLKQREFEVNLWEMKAASWVTGKYVGV